MPSADIKVGVFYFFRAWAVLRGLAQARLAGAAKNARPILTIFSHVSSLAVETNPKTVRGLATLTSYSP